jgi:hypothetical protein
MKRFLLYLLLLGATAAVAYFIVVKVNPPVDHARTSSTGHQSPRVESESVREEVLELRRRNHLRPLTEVENGAPLQQLPKGTYAFSVCGGASIHAKRDDPNLIEIHKRLDGIVYYVGYASKEDIGKYLAREKNFHIRAFPHSRDKTSFLFEIPVDFIFKCEARSSGKGSVYDLFVTAIPELHTQAFTALIHS